MTPEELAFLRQHCLTYAQGDEAYADWYLHWYGEEATLDDVPDHPNVHPRYVAQTLAMEERITGGAR